VIFSSTRPLGALAVALIVFGTLTFYTYAAKRQLAAPSGHVSPSGEAVDVEITVVSTGKIGSEEFALTEPHALRIAIDGQPLHQRESLDPNEPLVLRCSLRAGSEHRLLVEAIPEGATDHATTSTALRVMVVSANQPVVERVGWSEHGQAISEELIFRIPAAEEISH
jgi:hypothetical protein